ncbi:MAG: O-antigen ligase family protein [Coriobacteriia bacterium]|nr:O-antigen ligase family protein [Coriobacteriia bacterium]
MTGSFALGASARRLADNRVLWASAACLAGLVAGVSAVDGVDFAGFAAMLAGIVTVLLVLWRYEIGAVLMVLTLPLDMYGRILETPVVITVFHVVLVLTLASWVLRLYAEPERRVAFSVVDIGIAALVLAAVWSLPFSLDGRDTLIAVVRLLFLWAFTLLYANALSSRKTADWVLAVLVGTGVLNGAVALAQYFVPGFEYGNVRSVNQGAGTGVVLRRVGALFWDPNYLGGFLCVAFLTAVVLLVHSRKPHVALAWLASSAVIGGGLVVTFSRTGWVGAAVGLVVVMLTAPKGRKVPLLATGMLLVVLVVAISPGLIVDRLASIGEVEDDLSNATRYYMFYSSVDIMREHWVFGTGLAAFDVAFPEYRRLGTLSSVIRPHQLPLALWAEMGIGGLLAEITLIVTLAAVFWRRRPHGWHVIEAVAAAGLVSLLVQSWLQYYLYFEYLWLFIAFAVAGTRFGRLEEETRDGSA